MLKIQKNLKLKHVKNSEKVLKNSKKLFKISKKNSKKIV